MSTVIVLGGGTMRDARVTEALQRLATHRYAPTMPRLALIKTLISQPSSVSARELHAILRRAYPSFGQATVYRTLEILVACMLAQAFPHRSCEVRCAYRSAYPRHHLLCTACGLVVEVPSETLSGIRQSLQEQHFALQEQALTLLGTCGTCQGRSGCNSARP